MNFASTEISVNRMLLPESSGSPMKSIITNDAT